MGRKKWENIEGGKKSAKEMERMMNSCLAFHS